MLAPEAQLLDESAIALEVRALEVIQEPPAAADQLEQPAARVMVVLVRAEVLGQLVDATREHRDLDFGRPRVGCGAAVLLDDLLLLFLGETHVSPLELDSAVPARRPRKKAYGRGCGRRLG